MSFLTCRWLFPQKLQSSCSLPSVARATSLSFYPVFVRSARRFPSLGSSGLDASVGDDTVDDPIIAGFFGRHEVVALHVLRHPLEVLTRVLGDDLLHPPLQVDHLARLDL